VGSRSPTPPAGYPSPISSSVSDADLSSQSSRAAHGDLPAYDGPPPAKKQRLMKPRELATEYLDLCALNDSSCEEEHKAQDRKLRRLVEALRSKRKIVVVAGAGISVSAGSMFSQLSLLHPADAV
jgi:NAD-dependent histone deacetylase SIR2